MSEIEAAETTADAVVVEPAADAVEVDAGYDASVEVERLKAQNAELEAKNKFLAEGFVAAKRPAWIEEAARLHPELHALVGKAGLSRLEATSRRGFLRAAEALAETHAPSVAALRSLRESANAAVTSAREQAVQAARDEVQAAWGKPSADVLGGPTRDTKPDTAETLRKLVEG